MRDIKRYGWDMKERSSKLSFTTDIIEWDPCGKKKRGTGNNNSLSYKGIISYWMDLIHLTFASN